MFRKSIFGFTVSVMAFGACSGTVAVQQLQTGAPATQAVIV